MNFFRIIKAAVLTIGLGVPHALHAQAQSVWRYAVDPGFGIASADALKDGVPQFAIRCRGTTAPVSPNSYVTADSRVGVATLLLPPNLFPAGKPANVTLLIDDKFTTRFPAVLGKPEGAYATRILLTGPLMARLQSAQSLSISVEGGKNAQLGMTEASQAIGQLIKYCLPSVAQQAQVPRPGFDCAQAGTKVEQTICSFPDLAAADTRMSDAFAGAKAQNRVDQESHAAWIKQREECGADVACILQRTTEQATVLSGGTVGQGAGGTAQPMAVPQDATAGTTTETPQSTTKQGLQLQTAAPVPNPNAPPVVGQQAVSNAMLVWLLGQRPALLSNEQQLMQFRQVKFPPGAPQLDRKAWNDRNSRITWGHMMASYARTRPFPANVVYDVTVNITRNEPDAPFEMNVYGASGGAGLIREQSIQIMGNRGALRFIATNPYIAELPDAIKQGAGAEQGNDWRNYAPSSELLLRLHLTLQAPDINLPLDAQQLSYGNGVLADGRMTIRQIELIRKQRPTQQNQPEQLFLLHRWNVPETLPPIATDSLDTAEKVAAFYGGAVQNGRLIRFSHEAAQELGLSVPDGRFEEENQYGAASPAAEFSLRLATVLKQAEKRQMSYDMTQEAAFKLLNVIERDQVLPLGFENQTRGGSLNELERAQALRAAEPLVREIVLARAPAMPIKVSAILIGRLGEYDLGLQGFPLQMDVNQASWFPGLDLRAILPDRQSPDFIPVSEADALDLLQKLDVDSLRGRSLPIRVDYTIAGALTLSSRATPITPDELNLVSLGYAVERIVVFSDASFSTPLLEVPYPEAAERLAAFQRQSDQSGAPADAAEPGTPAAVFAELRGATSESVLGALVQRGFTQTAQGVVSRYQSIRTASNAARPALVRKELDRIKQLAQDHYWMVLVGGDRSHSSAGQMMTLRHMQFVPFAADGTYGQGNGARIEIAENFAAGTIPMTKEEYTALSEKLLAGGVLIAKMPASVRREGTLTVGRPVALAVLPSEPTQGTIPFPQHVVLLKKPEKAAPKVAGEVTAPEAVYLDHEGIDLLALSQNDALYNDSGYERMLIERAARERQAEAEERTPVWGNFFADPTLPLDADARRALLPDFKQWTRKRIKALPEEVILPIVTRGATHPATGCNEVYELRAGQQKGRVISEKYDDLFGAESETLKAAYGEQKFVGKLLPGSDRVFALAARPILTGAGRQPQCPYLTERAMRNMPPLLEGFEVSSAPYVDAVFLARGVPHPGNMQHQVLAVDYRLAKTDLNLLEFPRGEGDGAGFKGVLKIVGPVTEAAFWAQDDTRTPKIAVTITEQDWNAAFGSKLDASALDIVGLTIGMTEADLTAKIAERLPDGITFNSMPTARPNIFSHAVGRVDPAKSELIAAITAEASEGKPVLGIVRVKDFAPGAATIPALVSLLEEKYGKPNWSENNGQYLAWGVPIAELDNYGLCGGLGLIQRGGQAPQINFGPGYDQNSMRQLHSGVLQGYGWPQAEPRPEALQALDYCGVSVTVRIQEVGQGGLQLVTWLFDRTTSMTLAEEAETAAREAKPELDL